MPVFGVGGDEGHVAGEHRHRVLTLDLIVPTAAHGDQHLTAALGSVMHMPVIDASRLESHVRDGDPLRLDGGQVALPFKILGVGVIGIANGEEDGLGVILQARRFVAGWLILVGFALAGLRLRLVSPIVVPDLLGQIEGGPSDGPPGVKSRMGDDGSDLGLADPIGLAAFRWAKREESASPLPMKTEMVMMDRAFRLMSSLFHSSPKRTSSLK